MLSRIRAWVAAIGIALVSLAAVWFHGLSSGKSQRDDEYRDTEIETHERMNDADVSSGDPDDDRDWLRDRGQ